MAAPAQGKLAGTALFQSDGSASLDDGDGVESFRPPDPRTGDPVDQGLGRVDRGLSRLAYLVGGDQSNKLSVAVVVDSSTKDPGAPSSVCATTISWLW